MPQDHADRSDAASSRIEPIAPGAPGIAGRWTSAAKSGVGTTISSHSRVWFTLSHGIVNEVYYRRHDNACIRDMGLIVTGPGGYVAEEKRDCEFALDLVAHGTPAYRLTNSSRDQRWRIEKRIVVDPKRDVLMQETRFLALQGHRSDYRVFVLLAPHLVNRGADNTGWADHFKGSEMLFASGAGNSLALASSVPWLVRSAGYVGTSDGWQDLMQDGHLSVAYARAEHGNVALLGEIDLDADDGKFLLALGFGRLPSEAGWRARASLQEGFDDALDVTIERWQGWQAGLAPLDRPQHQSPLNLYRLSTIVLKTHCAPTFPGSVIASLSIPWGFSKGDEDLGGYHLVWPRDLVETAGGFLAAGANEEARDVLCYLQATQDPEGGWPQNMWLDGTPYWTGQQMDECAFPILLLDLLHRNDALAPDDLARFWPMAKAAAGFLVVNGPTTGQDRWEEDSGFSPFTLAVEIAALLAAAGIGRLMGDFAVARHLEETADSWNDDVERWTYVAGTTLAASHGIPGYYVRIGAPETADAASPKDGYVPIRNRPQEASCARAEAIVSPDALALVRFGLRAADDPRIVDTVTVVDAVLRADLPQGPVWRRYNEDGYGEHPDGKPFDGTGIGRPWPLLTGERAMYELAAGRPARALALMETLEASAGPGGMLPEQVWDGEDMPARELIRGRPTGSAMPLVWAHGEYIKLLRSLKDNAVFDMPPQTFRRYQVERPTPRAAQWNPKVPRSTVPHGRILRLEFPDPCRVHWSADDWRSVSDDDTAPSGLGSHVVDLATEGVAVGTVFVFTFYHVARSAWEGTDYQVEVV